MAQSYDKPQKTCFVIMGFGEKTDYQATPPRVIDLNRTYKNIIAPVVTEAGLKCVRADEIIHSTVIDKPMYEHLHAADLVIADLTTSNANAIYELGVRHALKPHMTVVMAEQGFSFPFDLNHLSILKYEHLGKEIGFDEVMRVRAALRAKILELIDKEETDSPVYMFLPSILGSLNKGAAPAPEAPAKDPRSLGDLQTLLSTAKSSVKKPADWQSVIDVLERLRKLQPTDAYLLQQVALATYKSELPTKGKALQAAKELLAPLQPEVSCDAETVGLWGAIHKRIFDITGAVSVLNTAVRAYARGYFIKNDYYNGINYAFLLNVRAARAAGDDAIADRVLARRICEEVLVLCEQALSNPALNGDETFWIKATQVEALLGASRKAEGEALLALLSESAPQAWMLQTLQDQLMKLAALNP